MSSPDRDESQIRELATAFAVAVARQVPREVAALMCADEAESFLDNVFDPDGDEPAEPVDEPPVEVVNVDVFGDVALLRFTRASEPGVLFFRRENGRWTVCADAEDDMSLEQLDATVPAHRLARKPIGDLSVEDLRELLEHDVGLDILLPRVATRLQGEPLARGNRFPGDLLAAALAIDRARWDLVSSTRMRIAVDAVRDMGDLAEHGAPHDEIWSLIAEFDRRQS